MLKSISIRNLGSFGNTENIIPLTKLTALVGPNNAGKSQVFAALNLVRHMVTGSPINYSTNFYRLNSFADAVHKHDVNQVIRISTDFERQGRTDSLRFRFNNDDHFEADFYEGTNHKSQTGRVRGYHFPDDQTQEIKKVWYFSPLRALIPSIQRIGSSGLMLGQPIWPDGSNVIQFLLERFNDRDPKWSEAEDWLRKIDPAMAMLKTPLRGENTYAETVREYGDDKVGINLSFQGTGIQNAATIISAVIFSPEGTTICIEEPENFLHPKSQEVIVDLFNYATTKLNKQIIFSTHSWSMLLAYISDIGKGSKRGSPHIEAAPDAFSLVTFKADSKADKVRPYDIRNKEFRQVRDDFKKLWG